MEFLIIAFATWIISYGLTSLGGPYGMLYWIREKMWHGRYGSDVVAVWYDSETKGTKEVSRQAPHNGLLDCIVCTSFWVGIALALLTSQPIVNGIGAAGLACLLHSYTGWKHGG